MSKWLDNAVFYEIYPQSFQDSNGDGIGDFRGIISRLDYIKDLGCNAIWVNPCYVSPFADAGYDVADYKKIAPRYGTNEDAKELFEEVHKRGMHIILDLVPGHTSIEHPWFKESMKAERNEYTDRYVWTDSIWTSPENMATIRGISERDGSCVVNFFSTQPALNYGFYEKDASWQMDPEEEGPKATLEAMMDVMAFWLDMGCDGFRVDMAGSLVKNDPEGKGTIALWNKVRDFLDKKYPEAAMVSEWGEPEKSLQGGFHMDFLLQFGTSYYCDLFRGDTPYFARKGEGTIARFVNRYKENMVRTEGKGLMCIPSSNHDTDRLSYSLDEEETKIAYAFLLSMPGAPFLYYGDEIGMRYMPNRVSVEGGYNRTGTRTPMQWDDTKNAGFSTAGEEKLYMPLDPDPNRPTVKNCKAREDSLYYEIKELIQIRMAHPALLSKGAIEFVYAEENAYPFAYIRQSENEKIMVILNPSGKEAAFAFDGEFSETVYSHGGEIRFEQNKIIAPAGSANFVLLK